MKSRFHSSKGLCRRCAERNKTKSSGGECSVCHNKIFERIESLIKLAKIQCSGIGFSSFSVSSKIPREFELGEEALWDRNGVSGALSLKTELNSDLASVLKKELGKEFSPDSPDINILLDFEENRAGVSISPLFLYGHYRKFSRDLSQTKWPCDCKNGCELCGGTLFKYSSVEDLVSKPLLKAFKARNSKFHGAGREDIDARMLGDGRPFVIELEEPMRRDVDLGPLENSINSELSGKVELSRLSFVPPRMVEIVKVARLGKSYRALVQTAEPFPEKMLARIPRRMELKQQTPNRVLHRRSDLERIRSVRIRSCERISGNTFQLIIDTDSGTYVKEFISGDGGRTKPNISNLLGVPAVCAELDVIGIDHSFISGYW